MFRFPYSSRDLGTKHFARRVVWNATRALVIAVFHHVLQRKYAELAMFFSTLNNFPNAQIILDKRGRGQLLLRNGNTVWPRLPTRVAVQPRVGSTGICVVSPGNLTRGHVCLLLAYPTFTDRRALPEDSGAAEDRATPAEEDATLAAIDSTRHRVDVLSESSPHYTRHGTRTCIVPL